MKRNSKTTSISDLLHSSAFSEMMGTNKLNAIVKHSTIFSFWDSVVGARFSKFTKPYSIKCQKLYVSAKSPVLVQELNLYKTKILAKINTYSKPLGIEIKDIIFSYKNFAATNPIENSSEKEDKPLYIKKEEVENLEISKEEKEKVFKSINRINFLNENQKEKLSGEIINNIKVKKLQEK